MPRKPPTAADREIMRAIGNLIRTARTAQKMTQIELASRLGEDTRSETIGRYEKGSIMPSGLVLVRIGKCLGIDAGALLPGTTGNPAEDDLLSRFRLLDGEGQALVVGLLRRMTG